MKEGTIGDVADSGRGVGAAGEAVHRRRRVLLFTRGSDVDAGFGSMAGAMLERDHDVVLALDHPRRSSALSELSRRHPGFEQIRIPARRGLWRIPAGATKRGLDYLRYLQPERASADQPRDLARDRAPRILRALLQLPPFRWAFGRRMLEWLLRHLDAGMPIPRSTKMLIKERSPDVVVISQWIAPGSPEAELIRSAHATKTPSVLVMSGTGGTDPAQIRDMPTLAVVGEQQQVNDVVQVHGIPRDRVQAVGAEAAGGARLPSSSGMVDAVDEAATKRASAPPGRLLRPVLWLLAPLLLLMLLVLHPVSTSKECISVVRHIGRQMRARPRKAAKVRAGERKAVAGSASQERRVRSDDTRERKSVRAQEKQRKREGRQHRKTTRPKARARASAETEKARTEA